MGFRAHLRILLCGNYMTFWQWKCNAPVHLLASNATSALTKCYRALKRDCNPHPLFIFLKPLCQILTASEEHFIKFVDPSFPFIEHDVGVLSIRGRQVSPVAGTRQRLKLIPVLWLLGFLLKTFRHAERPSTKFNAQCYTCMTAISQGFPWSRIEKHQNEWTHKTPRRPFFVSPTRADVHPAFQNEKIEYISLASSDVRLGCRWSWVFPVPELFMMVVWKRLQRILVVHIFVRLGVCCVQTFTVFCTLWQTYQKHVGCAKQMITDGGESAGGRGNETQRSATKLSSWPDRSCPWYEKWWRHPCFLRIHSHCQCTWFIMAACAITVPKIAGMWQICLWSGGWMGRAGHKQ